MFYILSEAAESALPSASFMLLAAEPRFNVMSADVLLMFFQSGRFKQTLCIKDSSLFIKYDITKSKKS